MLTFADVVSRSIIQDKVNVYKQLNGTAMDTYNNSTICRN